MLVIYNVSTARVTDGTVKISRGHFGNERWSESWVAVECRAWWGRRKIPCTIYCQRYIKGKTGLVYWGFWLCRLDVEKPVVDNRPIPKRDRSEYGLGQVDQWIRCRQAAISLQRRPLISAFFRIRHVRSPPPSATLPMLTSLRVSNDKSLFYIRTNKDAPRYKIVTIDLEDASREQRDLIPQDPDAFLQSVTAVYGNNLAIVYKRNVRYSCDQLFLRSSCIYTLP